jgi:hypothetical protein
VNTLVSIMLFCMTVRGMQAILGIMVFIAFLWCLNKVLRFK